MRIHECILLTTKLMTVNSVLLYMNNYVDHYSYSVVNKWWILTLCALF